MTEAELFCERILWRAKPHVRLFRVFEIHVLLMLIPLSELVFQGMPLIGMSQPWSLLFAKLFIVMFAVGYIARCLFVYRRLKCTEYVVSESGLYVARVGCRGSFRIVQHIAGATRGWHVTCCHNPQLYDSVYIGSSRVILKLLSAADLTGLRRVSRHVLSAEAIAFGKSPVYREMKGKRDVSPMLPLSGVLISSALLNPVMGMIAIEYLCFFLLLPIVLMQGVGFYLLNNRIFKVSALFCPHSEKYPRCVCELNLFFLFSSGVISFVYYAMLSCAMPCIDTEFAPYLVAYIYQPIWGLCCLVESVLLYRILRYCDVRMPVRLLMSAVVLFHWGIPVWLQCLCDFESMYRMLLCTVPVLFMFIPFLYLLTLCRFRSA